LAGCSSRLDKRSQTPTAIPCRRVLVNHRRHDFIAKGIDSIGDSLLRHNGKASGTRECVDEWVNRDLGIRGMVGANAESGICRGGKIDMKNRAWTWVRVTPPVAGLSMARNIASLPVGGGSPVRKVAPTKL
jgi:hypothetical protein